MQRGASLTIRVQVPACAPMTEPLEIADNLDDWRRLNTPFEGRVPCMYLDVKGLVTCGVGNLIDPVDRALRLRWRHGVDGPYADPQTVRDAWRVVKQCGMAHRGWRAYALGLNDLRLDDAEIDRLVQSALFANERYLVERHVPHDEWISWPADAQMFALSMAWALGAGWPAKPDRHELWSLMRARRWLEARAVCGLREDNNAGVKPRNVANRRMLKNAAVVDETGSDPDVLHWPRELELPLEAPTVPDLKPPTLIPMDPPEGWVNDLRKAHNLDGGDI